jgi:fructose-1,6-bisphosphatase I
MCKEAGGEAVDETGAPILDVQPKDIHQRTALYVGSKPMIGEITRILRS